MYKQVYNLGESTLKVKKRFMQTTRSRDIHGTRKCIHENQQRRREYKIAQEHRKNKFTILYILQTLQQQKNSP